MRNPASPLGENDFFGNQTRGVKFFRAGVCTPERACARAREARPKPVYKSPCCCSREFVAHKSRPLCYNTCALGN